jgi:hypothetical protein
MRLHIDRNARVTVVLRDTGEIVHAYVKKPGKELRIVYVREGTITWALNVKTQHWNPARLTPRALVNYNVRHRDEGVVWARGWDGPDVDALRATVALTTR